jgi:DNA repair photolyase
MAENKSQSKKMRHGRGTLLNPKNRFDTLAYESDTPPEFDEKKPETEFIWDKTQTILAKNSSPDLPYNFSINPYRGCEHGCVYCYARSFHEYLGFSAGIDFETKILVKRDAAKLLRKQFNKPSWKPALIALSGNTDPYQPIEKKFELTREILQVMAEYRNPVQIITKNALISRDIDILQELAKHHCVGVSLSISTLDKQITDKMEPRTSRPEQRLKTIQKLAEANIPVGVMMAPMIPGWTDSEIFSILQKAKDHGAQYASYSILRLQRPLPELFFTWMEEHFPLKVNKVKSQLKSIQGENFANGNFEERFMGKGKLAIQMKMNFEIALKKAGLEIWKDEINTHSFRRPGQLNLFPS